MADGGKTRIGRNRVRTTPEPVFEEDEPATFEDAAPIFVGVEDEGEYEVEEDDEQDVADADADGYDDDEPEDDEDGEPEDEPGDEDEEDDEQELAASDATGELIVRFAKVEDGVIRMSIHGEFTADITEGKDGAKTVYNSSEFGGSQTTLKRALESVGRNTVMRAVAKAWETSQPKEKKKPAAPRTGNAARIENLEAQLAQSNANMAAILALLEKKTAATAPADDDDDEQEAPPKRVRIARS